MLYNVAARIVSDMDGYLHSVWSGRIVVTAQNKKEAIKFACSKIEDTVVEYDERIHPRIEIVTTERLYDV